ncbi:MAG: erythromycin esterase family protein [Actinomycetota bacterium]|nr:erythromycin esterase family protein [Actinomycetota bacterium]
MRRIRDRLSERGTQDATELAERVREMAHPLREAGDLDPLLDRIGDARCVLLGEASHGTSEYYTWRARISERLILEKGFSFIAVEGDWPDCYEVNRYVKGYPDSGTSAREVLEVFDRWPTWMWANEEIVELVQWLRRHNEGLSEERVGFYGLDVYSLWESMEAVIAYLERVDPEAVDTARRAYKCFEPYGEDVREYARATAMVPTSCEDEVVEMLSELSGRLPEYRDDPESRFNAEQNALVVKGAEQYYRTMVRGSSASWNVRDRHMAETLERLMRYHGPEARAIVWEHNTHIGDARATDMADASMVNVGQLVREQRGAGDVVLVGFGSHRGSVIAGAEWGAPMKRMRVPAARESSWEDVLHRTGEEDKLLIFADAEDKGDLLKPRGHRAIGVVYEPARERYGNYVPTVLPHRYDAFVYLDETQALHPLRVRTSEDGEPPETFPSGV